MKEPFRCQNLLATSVCAQRCLYGHKQCEKVGETWSSTINYAVVSQEPLHVKSNSRADVLMKEK